jgi:class 3 adenylate cyclase
MLGWFFALRLRLQLGIIVTLLTVVSATAFYRYVTRLQQEMFTQGFTQTMNLTFDNVRIGVEISFSEYNSQILQTILNRVRNDSAVQCIVVTGVSDEVIAQLPEQNALTLEALQRFAAKPSLKDTIVVRAGAWRAVRGVKGNSDSTIIQGRLYIAFPTRELRQRETTTLQQVGVTALLALAAGFAVASVVAFGITRPLDKLQSVALQIASGKSMLRANDESGSPDIRTLASSFNLMLDRLQLSQARIEQQRRLLEVEQAKNEELLENMLPRSIAARLKSGETMIADSYPNVTVVFADIVGFTELASRLPPAELIDVLNRVFSLLDEFSVLYRVEKIKTIGDAYMVVSGAPDAHPHHAEAAALMALEIVEAVGLLRATLHTPLQVRVGIHTGSVVAGVIGTKKFAYDLWGDTVNTASRMESHSEIGRIQCSEAVYGVLKEKFEFEERGLTDVKGKGLMHTYFLTGRKPGATFFHTSEQV